MGSRMGLQVGWFVKTNHAIVVVIGACLGGWFFDVLVVLAVLVVLVVLVVLAVLNVFDTKRDLRMGWGVVVFDKGVVCGGVGVLYGLGEGGEERVGHFER